MHGAVRRADAGSATPNRLLARLLQRQPDESLLDIGCGTGYFTRRFAQESAANEIGELLAPLPVSRIIIRSGIFWPDGGRMGQWLERIVPGRMPVGAFLVVAGDRR